MTVDNHLETFIMKKKHLIKCHMIFICEVTLLLANRKSFLPNDSNYNNF